MTHAMLVALLCCGAYKKWHMKITMKFAFGIFLPLERPAM
jgi:hypothetical protein